jgi:hypothetical protein
MNKQHERLEWNVASALQPRFGTGHRTVAQVLS